MVHHSFTSMSSERLGCIIVLTKMKAIAISFGLISSQNWYCSIETENKQYARQLNNSTKFILNSLSLAITHAITATPQYPNKPYLLRKVSIDTSCFIYWLSSVKHVIRTILMSTFINNCSVIVLFMLIQPQKGSIQLDAVQIILLLSPILSFCILAETQLNPSLQYSKGLIQNIKLPKTVFLVLVEGSLCYWVFPRQNSGIRSLEKLVGFARCSQNLMAS